ncbi:hypothetical protein PRK78_000136 [Emydomyces testavorans]|uniref:Uncharacterized protein n=1 Tax=Emydomyces testavorans TaxID=2070801 RepID=A0AAF0DAE2_9EURO|nr:hypothetical protein PRK78_000136 [Emydomyces testavorans]
MNPDDKYLNPRPPPRPKLPRLLTSTGPNRTREALTSPASSSSPQHPVHGRSASHPRDLPARRKFRRVPAKLTLDTIPPVGSSTKGNPIQSTISNFKTPRSGGREADNDLKWGRNEGDNSLLGTMDYPRGRSPWSNAPSSSHSRPAGGHSGQTLQVPTEIYGGERPVVSPFGSRSRSRSRTRDRSPLRTPVRIRTPTRRASPVQDDSAFLSDESDLSDPSSLVVPCKLDIGSTVNLNEKRLPTLPNSPSSVLDEELQRIGAFKTPVLDMDLLHSRFSVSTTASPDASPDSFLRSGFSHFSECSTDTDAVSPSSMTSGSTFNNDTSLPSNPGVMTIEIPDFSSTEAPLSELVGLRIKDEAGTALSQPHNHDICSPPTPIAAESLLDIRISGLHIPRKPQSGHGPASQLHKYPCEPQVLDSAFSTPRASKILSEGNTDEEIAQLSSLHVQTMMQEIMDELSYLGNMIKVNAAEGL